MPPDNAGYAVAAYIVAAVILLGYTGALLRRATVQVGEEDEVLSFSDLSMDLATRDVRRGDRDVAERRPARGRRVHVDAAGRDERAVAAPGVLAGREHPRRPSRE